MHLKPPLAIEELHAIGKRNYRNKDVVDLLWEIKRLHSHVLRLDQLARSIPHGVSAAGLIAQAAAREVSAEPIVLKQRAEHVEIFKPDLQPGDDD
jgi:hypothetical protein